MRLMRSFFLKSACCSVYAHSIFIVVHSSAVPLLVINHFEFNWVHLSIPLLLCSGNCFVEKSSREDEETKLPPALRVTWAPNSASQCRTARDVRPLLWTENTLRHTPTLHCWTSQRCEGCPAISLDCELSVSMNTHNTWPSDVTSLTISQLPTWAVWPPPTYHPSPAQSHTNTHTCRRPK